MFEWIKEAWREAKEECSIDMTKPELKSWAEVKQDLVKEGRLFSAWVVLDEYNKAICYLDESLGAELDRSKKNYERENYKIIPLTGVIE